MLSNDHDHRHLGQRLDLFHLQEDAPGMVFWHPRGFTLYRVLEEAVRRQMAREGYREVRTPQVLRQPIWEASGHWEHFRANVFVLAEEERAAALKPVSCPGHLQIVARRPPSYRELPIRLGELDAAGARQTPVLLHRALLGSLERFLGVLLEHHAGALPAWLAPEQVVVAPVAEAQHPFADQVFQRLLAAGLRARLDTRPETLARKVQGAHEGAASFFAVIGRREVERGTVTLRDRGGQRELSLEDATVEIARECRPPI